MDAGRADDRLRRRAGREPGWRMNGRVWSRPGRRGTRSAPRTRSPRRAGGRRSCHHDVGDVREAVGAPQVVRRVRREVRQRVLALDPAVGEVVRAARAERDRAVLRERTSSEADVRMLAQRREQLRVALLDLLERQPARAPPSGRRGRGCPSRARRRRLAARRRSAGVSPPAARRLADRVPDHGVVLVAGRERRCRRVRSSDRRRGRRGRSRSAA